MPQIQRIMAQSLWQSRRSSGPCGPHILLAWSIAERMQALYTLPHILGERGLEVRAGKSFLNFPKATQHLAAMALSQPPLEHSISPRYQGVASRSSMMPSTSTAADSTGVLARFLEDILAITRTWSTSCWHGSLYFLFSLPCLELGDTLLLGVRDEHQVISVEDLPWYTSAELMGWAVC